MKQKADETGNALSAFLGHAITPEEIDARSASEENVELGQRVLNLLASAPISRAFKLCIATDVREAHAYKLPVPARAAPQALGIVDGPGVFSAEEAQQIEARALEQRLSDARPGDVNEAVVLGTWLVGFRDTYGDGALSFAQGARGLRAS